jgi:RNA polymerase sigma-70 factor (ECF subfamily)
MEESEQSWIAQARAGDSAAFGSLVGAYQQKVFGFILGMVRNAETADELTQNTFLRAWKGLAGFRAESAFQTWLFHIALNQVRSWGRWSKVRHLREVALGAHHSEEEEEPAADTFKDARPDGDPSRMTESATIGRALQEAVHRLPPREKEVFTMRHYEDMALKEIGEVLGIAEGSVKAHLFHALEKLRRCLGNPHEL